MQENRFNYEPPLLIFLLVFSLYLFSMQPSLSLGDGGELTCAAYFLGCAHPPGFPLFVSMSHLISLLPVGEVALRGNVFSALFGSLVAALIFIWLVEIHGKILAALGAIAVAAVPIFWEESTRIRTYPLLAFFVVLILLIWRASLKEKKWELFVASFFVLGIGLGAHQLLAGMLPAAAVISWAFREKIKKFWQLALALALGVLIFPHLLFRSGAGFCWGAPKDFSDFLAIIFQKQYQSKMATFALSTWLAMLKTEFFSFASQYAGLWLLAPLGFLVALTRERVFTIACMVAWLSMIFIRSGYIGTGEFSQVTRYLLGCYALFGVFCIEGLAWLLSRLRTAKQTIAFFVSFVLACSLVYRGASVNWQVNNRVAEQWATGFLYSRPFGSILVVGGDNDIFPLWYQQRAALYRADVVAMGRPGFWSGWLIGELKKRLSLSDSKYQELIKGGSEMVEGDEMGRVRFFGFLKLAPKLRPSFVLFDYTEPQDENSWALLNLEWKLVPRHYGFELVPHAIDSALSIVEVPSDPLWPLLSFRHGFERTAHEKEVAQTASNLLAALGRAYFKSGDLSGALKVFESACKICPDNPDLRNVCSSLLR